MYVNKQIDKKYINGILNVKCKESRVLTSRPRSGIIKYVCMCMCMCMCMCVYV